MANYCDCGRKVFFKTPSKRGGSADKNHTLCTSCYGSHRDATRYHG